MTQTWEKKLKASRDAAMARPELRTDGGGRTPLRPVAITSAPVKVVDADTRKLIDDAIAARHGGSDVQT